VQYSCVTEPAREAQRWEIELTSRRVVAVLLVVVAIGACGGSTPAASTGPIKVVAGQNFWGSIAAQLGGSKASVQSVVSDPNADPHEYETNTNDARAFADANYVILNGAGYDSWATKLLSSNPNSHRTVLIAADLLGKKAGDNPHFWYNPDYVTRMADQITAEYKSIDPADSAYFDQQRAGFTTALKPYTQRLAEIKAKFAGVPVAATESIFVYMATALGLNLISPPEFMNAVAEGNDPPAAAVIDFQNQITSKQAKVLVYNVQTATAVTTNIKHLAALADVPVVGVSETLQPETATFQDWQLSQLLALQNALNAAALTS
jgi:zinc/manganese transport system substrate-binding protein